MHVALTPRNYLSCVSELLETAGTFAKRRHSLGLNSEAARLEKD